MVSQKTVLRMIAGFTVAAGMCGVAADHAAAGGIFGKITKGASDGFNSSVRHPVISANPLFIQGGVGIGAAIETLPRRKEVGSSQGYRGNSSSSRQTKGRSPSRSTSSPSRSSSSSRAQRERDEARHWAQVRERNRQADLERQRRQAEQARSMQKAQERQMIINGVGGLINQLFQPRERQYNNNNSQYRRYYNQRRY